MDAAGSDEEAERQGKAGFRSTVKGTIVRATSRVGKKAQELALKASSNPHLQSAGISGMIKRVFRRNQDEDGDPVEEDFFEIALSPLPTNIPSIFKGDYDLPKSKLTEKEGDQTDASSKQPAAEPVPSLTADELLASLAARANEERGHISSLDDDMLLEVLVRVDRRAIGSALKVCRNWRAIIQSAAFDEYREARGSNDNYLFVVSNITVYPKEPPPGTPQPQPPRSPTGEPSAVQGTVDRDSRPQTAAAGSQGLSSSRPGPSQDERHSSPLNGAQGGGGDALWGSPGRHVSPARHGSPGRPGERGEKGERERSKLRQGLSQLKAQAKEAAALAGSAAVYAGTAIQQQAIAHGLTHAPVKVPPPPESRLLIQVFFPKMNRWLKHCHIPAGAVRIDDYSQVCTLGNSLIIFPGILGKGQPPMRYSPWTNTLTPLPQMHVPRLKFVCGQMGGRLYVAGGMREQAVENDPDKKDLKSAEVYDPRHDRWFQLPDMQRLRYAANGGCCEGRMIVVGGTRSHGQFRPENLQPSVEVLKESAAEAAIEKALAQEAAASLPPVEDHPVPEPRDEADVKLTSTGSQSDEEKKEEKEEEQVQEKANEDEKEKENEKEKAKEERKRSRAGRGVQWGWDLREPKPELGLLLGCAVLGSSVFFLRNESQRKISFIRYNSRKNEWKTMHDVPGIPPDPTILSRVEFKLVPFRAKLLIVQVRGTYGDVNVQAAASAKKRPLVMLYNPKGEGTSLYKRMNDVPVVCQGAVSSLVRC